MKIFRKLNSPVTTSIGMFDLFKGIAMVLIVLMHNRSNFPMLMIDIITKYSESGTLKNIPFVFEKSIIAGICISVLGAVLASLMPAMFILSGYSVRKRPILKNFSLEMKELIKPYLWTTIVTVLFNIIIHFCFFRYLPGAFQESLKVLAGMLLGFSQTVQFENIIIFANGPVWFILALFWALGIFNILLSVVDEAKIKYYALGLSIIGWLLSYTDFTPFCLSQGLVGVLYVYMGYYIRKNKALTSQHSRKNLFNYTSFVIIPNIILVALGMITEMSDNVYSLGPVTYIESGLLGIGVLYVFLRINKLFNGKIANALRYLGVYSLYFMCIHTVEMIAVPWYVIAEKLINQPVLGFVILYIFRLIIIVIALKILVKFIEIYKSHMYRSGGR
ncbi:Acyltransferase family protein [Pseudobutyrivibrio sp. ACV-2]|uniref:acyltransferase family protein n=1 Tax=Pseudobutyrivibrio sp. ACV-2 TaxID=1520801 RepID=UPI000895C94F|nr:acyltransferase family protein [Pseudobutyrivibrio sp. ACV-2]SEA76992.1 Acyltransferase family protein [Pseudobutyrivibrio sp. ACV-2]